MKESSIIDRAKSLCEYSPRLWENEKKSAEFIVSEVEKQGFSVQKQAYQVVYPVYEEYYLKVDGEDVECVPSGLETGYVREKTIIDNWNLRGSDFKQPNINFNPHSEDISKPSTYPAPALTISKSDVQKVLDADDIEGYIEVSRSNFTSYNLLVGNQDDPRKIFFTHYDSWWGGFIDNALAVSAFVEFLPHFDLEQDLVVFAGSEEFSNEEKYWCYGFREFEKSNYDMLAEADELIVVDGIGTGEPVKTDEYLSDTFLINNTRLWEKTTLITNMPDTWKEIYHSRSDKVENIDRESINRNLKYLRNFLNDN